MRYPLLRILALLFLIGPGTCVLALLTDDGHTLSAQTAHRALRRGNQAYKEQDFSTAEAEYNRALDAENSAKGNYNLGNALYERGEFEEAGKRYEEAASLSDDPTVKSRAYRNLGDSYYQRQDYEKAVDNYKNSLRINPDDVETKYNLSKAIREIRKQEQQQQQQQDQQSQQQNDQQQQQQGEGQQQSEDQQSGQGQQQQQENGEQREQPASEQQSTEGQSQADPRQGARMSREEAERQLQIAEDAEKETLRRRQQNERSGCTGDKDW